MSGGLKSIVVNILLAGVFIFALISFMVGFANDNNTSVNVANDPALVAYNSSLITNIDSFGNKANTSENSFISNIPVVSTLSLVFSSVGSIWKTVTIVPQTIYNLTIGLIVHKIFNEPTMERIINVFTWILVVITLLYAWYWIRSGVPD